MHLLLGQLVYTSFPGMGFRTLASAEVPTEIQQAFIQRVVSKHWDSYNPPRSGYRAVYLHQIAKDQSLFGWLYNDGADDMGRSNVPYFICYYLAKPLLDFQLENIFTCLHKGPVALIDRRSLPDSLETIVVPDLWSYQPARLGVAIPLGVRGRSHTALKQRELLDIFVSVDEQEMVSGLNRHLNEDPAAIKVGVIKPYPGYKEKLQQYYQALIEAIQREYPINDNTRNSLRRLQQFLRLRDKDIELLESQILRQIQAVQPSTKFAGAIHTKYVTPVKALKRAEVAINESNNRSLTETVRPQIITILPVSNICLDKTYHRNYLLAYKNSQMLLGAGIAATFLALLGSIYGLFQTSIFAPSKPGFISSYASSSVFYKTLDEVPNVPQGIFKYGGSTSFAPLRSKAVVSAINQAQPKFQLSYAERIDSKPGSGMGLKMLLAGELSFAQSSRSVKDTEFRQAKERGFTLKQIPVAIDGIAFYVNSQVSIPGLSLSQLKDIFTGKISNWKAVGGPDLPITAFRRNLEASGTVDFVKQKVLAGEKFGTTVQEVETTTESIRKVAQTPGGIGFATASEVIGQQTIDPIPLHTIHSVPLSKGTGQTLVSPFADANFALVNKTAFANGFYPLTRQIFVIIKRDGGIDEQVGLAYANLLLTDEGQRLVEQAGFAPIR